MNMFSKGGIMGGLKFVFAACLFLAFQAALAQGLSPKCMEEILEISAKEGFALDDFLAKLPTAVAKVKAQEKTGKIPVIGLFMGPGDDSKATDAGITVGCAKTFPESAGDIQASVGGIRAELERMAKEKAAGSVAETAAGVAAVAIAGAVLAAADSSGADSAAPSEPAALGSPAVPCKGEAGTFTDARDMREYKQVSICGQEWMAENLNYEMSGSACYNNEAENCNAYGKLYNWATAMTACPLGWRLPASAEWGALADLIGGKAKAGKLLKTKAGWNSDGGGSDDYGFAALPGGYRSGSGGFGGSGELGYWWSASEDSAGNAYSQYISSIGENVNRGHYGKAFGFSVRCVKGRLEAPVAPPPAQEQRQASEEPGVDLSRKDEAEHRKIDVNINVSNGEGNASFWAGLAFDLIGAGFVAHGIIKYLEAKDLHRDYSGAREENYVYYSDYQAALRNKWNDVNAAQKASNTSYIIGGAALGIGIGIHVFF